MSLYRANDYISNKPTTVLSVTPGSSSIETVFSWNFINNATEYDVKIWRGKLWDSDPYYVEWGVKSNSWKTILPAGTYSAYIDVRYGTEMSMSNSVEFTVNPGCILSVTPGNESVKTLFSWNAVENAAEYDVKIWKGKLWDGEPYHIEWGVKSNSLELLLPIGTYSAYVDTRINSGIGMSNIIYFKIDRGSKLEVRAGNTSTNTVFSWNHIDNASEYDIKIWKGKLWEGDPYHIEWGIKSDSWKITLSEGTYQAYIDARIENDIFMSNIVEFKVEKGICSHLYGSWTVTQSSTCILDGRKTRTCSSCGYKEIQTISKTGHKYTTKVFAPTYTEKGYTLHTCNLCGDSYKDSYTDIKIKGDINNDNNANISDIVILNQFLYKYKTFAKEQYYSTADINNDGKINVLDLILLKRLIINIK